MYCLCVAGFGGDECCIVCVLQGLVVMSVLFGEGLVVMSVLFVCCRVWW